MKISISSILALVLAVPSITNNMNGVLLVSGAGGVTVRGLEASKRRSQTKRSQRQLGGMSSGVHFGKKANNFGGQLVDDALCCHDRTAMYMYPNSITGDVSCGSQDGRLLESDSNNLKCCTGNIASYVWSASGNGICVDSKGNTEVCGSLVCEVDDEDHPTELECDNNLEVGDTATIRITCCEDYYEMATPDNYRNLASDITVTLEATGSGDYAAGSASMCAYHGLAHTVMFHITCNDDASAAYDPEIP